MIPALVLPLPGWNLTARIYAIAETDKTLHHILEP